MLALPALLLLLLPLLLLLRLPLRLARACLPAHRLLRTHPGRLFLGRLLLLAPALLQRPDW